MNNMFMNETYVNDLYASGIIKDKERNIYLKRIENYKQLVQQHYENLVVLQQKNNEEKKNYQDDKPELFNSDSIINNVKASN